MKFEGNSAAPLSYLTELASAEIEQVKNDLPDALHASLNRIAIILEDFPSPEDEALGVERDQLGLFEGAGAGDDSLPQTPKIVLWLGNLWEMCGASESEYREEVRVTLLHELGHYLGFDEDELFDRGLE